MFFTFNQNNSGGKTVHDSNVSDYVIIEANDYKEANYLAQRIGIYFDGCASGIDCSCCGDRWSEAWNDDGDEEPMIYNESVKTIDSYFRGTVKIHYKSGEIETIELKR